MPPVAALGPSSSTHRSTATCADARLLTSSRKMPEGSSSGGGGSGCRGRSSASTMSSLPSSGWLDTGLPMGRGGMVAAPCQASSSHRLSCTGWIRNTCSRAAGTPVASSRSLARLRNISAPSVSGVAGDRSDPWAQGDDRSGPVAQPEHRADGVVRGERLGGDPRGELPAAALGGVLLEGAVVAVAAPADLERLVLGAVLQLDELHLTGEAEQDDDPVPGMPAGAEHGHVEAAAGPAHQRAQGPIAEVDALDAAALLGVLVAVGAVGQVPDRLGQPGDLLGELGVVGCAFGGGRHRVLLG